MRVANKNGLAQKPLPYAFARRDEFLRLPPESRTAHLWEAYAFCEAQLGHARFSDDELHRNLRVLRRMMLRVAKEMAKKLHEDGTWQDAADPRWPRNHKGDDVDHWYDSGAFPPQFLALPEDAGDWRATHPEHTEAILDEMVAWIETPAGQAGVGDEDLQRLLNARDNSSPAPTPSKGEAAEPSAFAWESTAEVREEGLGWLARRSADGNLGAWSSELELGHLKSMLAGEPSNRRPMDRLLPDLMGLESSGEFESLQRHLDVESPTDAAQLAKLRACLPRVRA